MTHLSKSPKPQILVDNEVEWTQDLLTKIQAGTDPTSSEKGRYRHKDIKSVLISETNGKCAYCESKLRHIHHGDIEHIYPKSLDPALSFTWENLTLSCEICNQNKTNLDPLLEKILDPYTCQPDDHLIFTGPLVFPRGTPEGISTRVLLDLNRGELAEQRRDHLEKIMGIFDTVSRTDIPLSARKAIYKDLLDQYASKSGEYSAMVRSVIRQIRHLLPKELADLPVAA